MKHYLDYNATTPSRPEVLTVMQELQSLPLNASSVHALGRRAKGIIEDARRTLAETIGAFAGEVIFTASGTEANNWVLRVFSDRAIIISAIEHSSIFKAAHAVTSPLILPVTPDGVVDMEVLEKSLPRAGGFLVSVMLANNETGVIQPVRAIADMVHARGGLVHCDAVQAFGKILVNFSDLGCDLMTLSAHKMGGPVGAAALIVRNNLGLTPMLIGGGQELNRRAGTENIAAIAGFAKAAEHIDYAHMKKIRTWLDRVEEDIITGGTLPPSALRADSPAGLSYSATHESHYSNASITSALHRDAQHSGDEAVYTQHRRQEPPRTLAMPIILGKAAPRLPNTACITMPNVVSETQLISFDLEGIAVSAGSACSSGRVEPSHVMKAMGIGDSAASTAIRISGGWGTTEKDIDALANVWKKLFLSKNPLPSK